MAFQRSYSKVWWESSNEGSSSFPYYNEVNNINGFDSFDETYNNKTNYTKKNLSKTNEYRVSPKLMISYNSPGSLKSHDSGFSDNDDLTSIALKSPKLPKRNLSLSPARPKTPPTVIRRKQNNIEEQNMENSNRLSLSAPSSPITNIKTYDFDKNNSSKDTISLSEFKMKNNVLSPTPTKKRFKYFNLKIKKNIFNTSSSSSSSSSSAKIGDNNNNHHLVLPIPGKYHCNYPYHLEDEERDDDDDEIHLSNAYNENKLAAITSTPKLINLPYSFNSNDKLSSLHDWFRNLRTSYCHEVMSTLQSKSISLEAYRNLTITTHLASKVCKQLQMKAITMQIEFDNLEKILFTNEQNLYKGIECTRVLTENVENFIKIIENRITIMNINKNKYDNKNFIHNFDCIKLFIRDLKLSLEKYQYLDFQSILDDICKLKKLLLTILQFVYEKLIQIIVEKIENSKCDLMLRANLNMIVNLSNANYHHEFALLNDAFNKNETVKILLIICIDSKLSNVRALALRALSTVCSSTESIMQFCQSDGIDIIKDILISDKCKKNYIIDTKITEPEKREAISLLTQITAPWHGKDHIVFGLKNCIEFIVGGLTDIIVNTNCCQILLLCAASLNNLSRIEPTSLYSIMSNETILRLKEAVEKRGPIISIFLCEQIVCMLQNMSISKKCRIHLSNTNIINFLLYIFQTQFHRKFTTKSENESQRATIKMILRIFIRLTHDSLIEQDFLDHKVLHIFTSTTTGNDLNDEYLKDISILSHQMKQNNISQHKILPKVTVNNKNVETTINLNLSSTISNKNNRLPLSKLPGNESYV